MTRTARPGDREGESTSSILADGTREWSRDGVVHRLDGPAIESSDGTTEWYFHGQRHREDGPAVEYASGASESRAP